MYPNPIDFTPKAVYEEIDRQNKRHRREMLVLNVMMISAWIACIAFMIFLIKHL